MSSPKRLFCLLAVVALLVSVSDAWAGKAEPVELSVTPVLIRTPAPKISVGSHHACATDSKGRLFCWGDNQYGQVGSGTSGNVQKTPYWVKSEDKFLDVGAGGDHTCAVKLNGSLWCWGSNGNGQLGIGSYANQVTPTQVGSDTNWFQVFANGSNTCGRKQDKSLWCWGDNEFGQTTKGAEFSKVNTPHRLTMQFEDVAVAGTHICAIKADSSLWCWGENTYGQLGLGFESAVEAPFVNSPTRITSPESTGWESVSASAFQTCAVRDDGTLWCWGQEDFLSQGYEITSGQYVPKRVTRSSNFVSVSVGGNRADRQHAGVINSRNELFCWGDDTFGEVGDGGTVAAAEGRDERIDEPTKLSSPRDWLYVSAGGVSTCGISLEGEFYCWGDNTKGQVGDGKFEEYRSFPTKISVTPSFLRTIRTFFRVGD